MIAEYSWHDQHYYNNHLNQYNIINILHQTVNSVIPTGPFHGISDNARALEAASNIDKRDVQYGNEKMFR